MQGISSVESATVCFVISRLFSSYNNDRETGIEVVLVVQMVSMWYLHRKQVLRWECCKIRTVTGAELIHGEICLMKLAGIPLDRL